ncbi:MAG: hypothetical protein FJ088_05875, partial [Deltaproteobacteria bacterium]|nr:hypothetical protein [Deltaproteobacteria bacterium]
MTNEAVFILSAVAAVSVTLLLLLAGIVTVAPALGVANGETDEKGDESSLRLLISAIGWGFGVIPLLTFWLHLFTRARFSIWLMAAATLMNLIAVAAWRLYRDRRLPRLQAFIPISIVPRAIKSNRLLFIAAALVAFYYFLNFESRLPIDSSCIYAAALEATGFIDGGHDLLKDNIDDTRLGNTALLAAALALYGTFGFRLVYGVCGFLLFLGGFLIGRDAGGSRPWGWMGAIFLSLNPYVLTIPLPDENLFALTAGAAMLHLLFFPRRNWILIGALFALVVTIRHVLVLALPALLYSVFHDENRKIAFAHFMAAFTVLTLPEHMHHHYALGSVFRFESHAQFPPFQYDIFGFGFQWNGMLNWPFHDSIVRTPHNPYPTFLLWILAV